MMRIESLFRRAHRWIAAVAVSAIAATAGVAHGQLGDASGFADLATRDYLHRDMAVVAQALDLDDGQRAIIDSLYEDYVSQFEAGWTGTQEAITNMLEDVQSISPEQAISRVIRPFEDWRRSKMQLKQQFESSIKNILNDQQLEQWPSFERRMLREKRLHEGRLSGENVNLFDVIRDLRLDERTMTYVEPILEEYSIALHEALKRRTDAIRDARGDFLKMISSNEDPTRRADAEKQIVNFRLAVRDVNDRFRDRIAAGLPHEKGEEFKLMALERGYPRVYRPLPAVRAYRQALELEDLDEETRAGVQDLWVIFEAELDILNNRLMNNVRDFEPRQMRNQADIYAARQRGERVERLDDPTHTDMRNRDARAEYYVGLLRDLLGEERFAELPAGRRWVEESQRQTAAREARQRIRERREMLERAGENVDRDPRRDEVESRRSPAERRDAVRRERGGRGTDER